MAYIDQYPERDNLRTGFAGNLTEQQSKVFAHVMHEVERSEYARDLQRFAHPDWFILRFLRATMLGKNGERVFQPALALERLYNTLKWRREKDMETIRANIATGNWPEGYLHYYNDLRPRMIWTDPKTGRPISVEKLGMHGQYVNVDTFPMETWELFYVYDLERIMLMLDEQSALFGFEIGTKITVFDLEGLGMGALSRIKVLKLVSRIVADHYPEQSGPIFLFNAPWTFSKIFALVTPLLDNDTKTKICVSTKFDLELMNRVLTNVEDFLPEEYGGKSKEKLKACVHAPKQGND